MALRDKTIKGLTWSGVAQIVRQASQFTILAILARLLSPDTFGLIGMVVVFTDFITIFNEMGINSALIQKLDIEEKHLSSVFWFNMAVGVLLVVLVVCFSPLIAKFYNRMELRSMLQVLSIVFLINAFGIVQSTLFVRKVEFKALVLIEIAAVIFSGALAIYFAFSGYGVWSLVYQLVIFAVIKVGLLWMVSSWRPKFIFSIDAIKDFFNFSMNIVGFNILNYFSRNIDYLLIGKFLGAESLGWYTLAYKLMLFPLQNISNVIGSVMYPVISRIQHDLHRVRNAYMKMVKAISLVAFPMMFGLFAVAPEFVQVILGPNWHPSIYLIRIFCICGVVQSIGTTVGTIYLSQGRADLQFKLQFLGTAVVALSIMSGLKWGVIGVAIFYTAQAVFWVLFNFYIVNNLIKLDYKLFYAQLRIACVMSFLMLFIMLFSRFLITNSPIIRLFVSMAVGLAVYVYLLLLNKEVMLNNKKITLAILK